MFFFKNVYCVEVFRTIKFVQDKVAVKNLQRNTLLPTVKSYIWSACLSEEGISSWFPAHQRTHTEHFNRTWNNWTTFNVAAVSRGSLPSLPGESLNGQPLSRPHMAASEEAQPQHSPKLFAPEKLYEDKSPLSSARLPKKLWSPWQPALLARQWDSQVLLFSYVPLNLMKKFSLF